jgi:ribose transport system substrate-binding protein
MKRSPRNTRRTVLTAACMLLLVMASACSIQTRQSSGTTANANGPIRLAVVPKAIGFAYWEQVRLGAQCATDKQPGVSMHWDGVTAETDVSGQQNLLQNLLAQGNLNGLVYAATDAKVLSQVTQSALQRGVTVVNVDSGTTPQPSQVPVFATDNVAAAKKGTDLLAEQLGGHGDIAFIEFQPGSSTNETRAQGFRQELTKYPGLRLVADQSSDSDYNKALQVTQDILTANPNLSGIYAANEPSVLGAAEAVRQAGKAGKVTIVGWDTSSGEIQAVRDGVITALIAQNPFKMGFDGVTMAVAEIRKQPPPRLSTDTGAMVITKDNLSSPDVQKLLNPNCANPPQ